MRTLRSLRAYFLCIFDLFEKKDKIFDKIYVLLADNLYKVQIGDYKSRIEAESLRNKIKKYYEGAFIINSTIFEDKESRNIIKDVTPSSNSNIVVDIFLT